MKRRRQLEATPADHQYTLLVMTELTPLVLRSIEHHRSLKICDRVVLSILPDTALADEQRGPVGDDIVRCQTPTNIPRIHLLDIIEKIGNTANLSETVLMTTIDTDTFEHISEIDPLINKIRERGGDTKQLQQLCEYWGRVEAALLPVSKRELDCEYGIPNWEHCLGRDQLWRLIGVEKDVWDDILKEDDPDLRSPVFWLAKMFTAPRYFGGPIANICNFAYYIYKTISGVDDGRGEDDILQTTTEAMELLRNIFYGVTPLPTKFPTFKLIMNGDIDTHCVLFILKALEKYKSPVNLVVPISGEPLYQLQYCPVATKRPTFVSPLLTE